MAVLAPTLRAVTPAAVKMDARLSGEEAQATARAALASLAGPGDIGDFAGATMEGERLASLAFECLAKGYRGWYWVVTLSRVPRSRTATVCETELLPGDGALLSPPWIAWSDRLRPGDLGAGDVLPFQQDDPRLEPGFEETGPDADQLGIFELGLGRERVLSREGRDEAATRWYDGDGGPAAPIAQRSKAPCSTCGFLIPMAGSLRQLFGVCANEWSPSDGKVVSYDHGCGAHSETDVKSRPSTWPGRKVMLADSVAAEDIEVVTLAAAPAAGGEPQPGAGTPGDAGVSAGGEQRDEAGQPDDAGVSAGGEQRDEAGQPAGDQQLADGEEPARAPVTAGGEEGQEASAPVDAG